LDGLHARRSFEIRGIDSTQTLHSDTDAAVLPGNTAPWLFSRTQYANGLGSAVRISPCRLTALALVRGVIRASAQSDLAMRELVLLTHATQRNSTPFFSRRRLFLASLGCARRCTGMGNPTSASATAKGIRQ
jgi:hypothetical protein